MADNRPPGGARPRRHGYLLIEQLDDGSCLRETFQAPSNSEAIARVEEVLEGREAALWRGSDLVRRWRPEPHAPAVRSFEPCHTEADPAAPQESPERAADPVAGRP